MTTDTEALRAQFEREFGKSPYGWPLSRFEKSAWAGQYTDLKTQYGWEGFQVGHAAAKAETVEVEVEEPLFWFRPSSVNGLYEGPLHNAQIEQVRKDSGAWVPLYTASQLAAAVAAEREKCAGIVNELRMECARRNMPESATMLWHAEDAIRAGAKEASDG